MFVMQRSINSADRGTESRDSRAAVQVLVIDLNIN